MIHCRTLGLVDVTVGGAPAPADLLWRKNLGLLVYLARSPKRARSREHLIGVFWADKADAAARHSLNEALRVIRRCVGDGGIETEADRIALAPDAVRLDVEDFEASVGRGDWAAAAALVTGEFLDGFIVAGAPEFDQWLAAERRAWRARSVNALVRHAERLLAAGRDREAAEGARRALALDPLAEKAVQALMRSLALGGERAAALDQFDVFAARLREDVGADPDPETVALVERVRCERVRRTPVAASGAVGTRRAPLVGRASELACLLGAWQECRQGRAAVALVDGDGGTGKTRIAEELVARARLDGAAVASVRAVAADADHAGSGLLGLARGGLLDAAGLAGAAPAALAAFATQIAEWHERFAAAVRGVAPGPLGPSFVEVVRAVAAERPVVLLADDAHWLDRESLLALDAATRDLARAPVLVLLTGSAHPSRSELDELRARIGRDVAGCVLRLGPLENGALRELARWAMPRYDAAQVDRLARRVRADSAGLPLIAVELLHAVALGLDLEGTRGAWPQQSRTLDQTLPGDLPEAVVGAIRVGFRRLSPGAQKALAAVAVLGDRVPAGTIGRATGLSSEPLADALDELEWERWLNAEPRGYAFLARIVRDIVARDLVTPGQRQRMIDAAR